MKKFILLALVLAASVVNAAEVVVMEANLPRIMDPRPLTDTRFYMDTKTGEGFVKAAVSETRYVWHGPDICHYDRYGRCFPGNRGPQQQVFQVYNGTRKIEGLMLMGDQAIYHGAEGNVVCGTMGTSRIFKVPTLYLSGNCKLEATVVRQANGDKLVVKLITK